MPHIAIFPLEGIDPELVLGMVLTDPKKIDACQHAPGIRLASDGIHWGDNAHWVSANDLEWFGAEDQDNGMLLSKDMLVRLENDISALERYMFEPHFHLLYMIWDGWHGKTTCMFARSSTVNGISTHPQDPSGATSSEDDATPTLLSCSKDDEAVVPAILIGAPSTNVDENTTDRRDRATTLDPDMFREPLTSHKEGDTDVPAIAANTSSSSNSKTPDKHPPRPTVETIYTDEDLDIAADSLHPIIATRYVLLTPAEAAFAEDVYARYGERRWYDAHEYLVDTKAKPISLSNGMMEKPMNVSSNVLSEAATSESTESISSNATNVPWTVTTAPSGGRKKQTVTEDAEEPLVDLTQKLDLHSKKTSRLEKKLKKKSSKPKKVSSFLDLPTELLQDVLSYLRPSDISTLSRVSKSTKGFIDQHEPTLAREITSNRYAILSRCFPLPVRFLNVPETAHSALLSPKRQEMLNIHKKPYQHVLGMDPHQICTCMTCVFAWNNLCMIVDLAHWQHSLDNREPIPMIKRGQTPEWNQQLIADNARIVEQATTSPLLYAAILEKHLRSTTATILRRSKYVKARPVLPEHRAYHLSYAEAEQESDAFLARKGPPSYEFPYHRDNYYNVEAYVPNRKWSKEQENWLYYHGTQHERDLEWVVARFGPEEDGERVGKRVEELGRRLGGGMIAY